MKSPQAFLSYTHFDDKNDRRRITKLREALSNEIQAQTGKEFKIFQDVDIQIGDNWKARIDESVTSATFLIPVLTPSYFKSNYCLDELEQFLETEKKRNRGDLILPIHYIDCLKSNMEQDQARSMKLHKIIFEREYFDWTGFRTRLVAPAKEIRLLSSKIIEALGRVNPLDFPHKGDTAKPNLQKRSKSYSKRLRSDMMVKHIDMRVTLNQYGDGRYVFRYAGVSCKPGKSIKEAILTRHTSWGQFGRFSILPTGVDVYVEKKLVNPDESVEAIAKVKFDKPLTAETQFDLELKMTLFGAFASDTQEQKQRRIPEREGIEWISFTVDNPTEKLWIALQQDFPGVKFTPTTVDIAIIDRFENRKQDLEMEVAKPLINENFLRWQIDKPQTGFRYELRWKLPDVSPYLRRSETGLSPEDVRKIIIDASNSAPDRRLFSDWVNKSHGSYVAKFGDRKKGGEINLEDIDISMHVLNDEEYRLKLVAGEIPLEHAVWRWAGFKPGTGLVGRSYKCNRVAFYSSTRTGREDEVYIDPKDPIYTQIELEPYEALLCCPIYWHTGRSRRDIIALINIGSRSMTSKLHNYLPKQEFDEWLKDISKSALKNVVKLISGHKEKSVASHS
ncbi:MAG TPA: toll/interleukin-1 receptor domain-containing protein [Candidatus Angelobacter sp.]|nr:toll/interleukin-1 receptor domain-containing protein [Candidatus Angelobacter sp.]